MTTPVCHASCLSNKLSINITSLCLLGSGVHFLSSAATHSLSFSFVLSASIPEASVSTNERLYSFCLHLVARWKIGIRSVAYGFHLFISDGDQTRVCVSAFFSFHFSTTTSATVKTENSCTVGATGQEKMSHRIWCMSALHCTVHKFTGVQSRTHTRASAFYRHRRRACDEFTTRDYL